MSIENRIRSHSQICHGKQARLTFQASHVYVIPVTASVLRWPLLVLIATLTSFAFGMSTSDMATGFDSANKLYAEGKFTAAATAYEQLIRTNGVSEALWFNLGNAHFKSGSLGRAIAAYGEASRLDPRDDDLRANLQFARARVTGPTLHFRFWERWLATLSLSEWSWLAAAAIWCVFGLLTAQQIRPALAPVLRAWLFSSTIMAVLLCTCLGLTWTHWTKQEIAIVATQEASIRTSPFDESPGAFTANDGAELRVIDRKNNWLQVTDGSRQSGWVKSEQVALFPRR